MYIAIRGRYKVVCSFPQVVYDSSGLPAYLQQGEILTKVTFDFWLNLYDFFSHRSWYVNSNGQLVDVGRGSYIETKCLVSVD